MKEWKDFEASLGGAFSARARGFLGTNFSLENGADGEFGTLRLEGSGARFEAGGVEGHIEASRSTYRMLIGGEEVSTAVREGSKARVTVGRNVFDAKVSLLRNTATLTDSAGGEVVRVSGGMSNRRYEVSFEGGGFGEAVFILFLLASIRSRAFRAGAAAR